MHSTNYYDTFIEVADDCPITTAEIPPEKSIKTAANLQFEMVKNHPYQYTSDEVFFQVFVLKKNIDDDQLATEKENFFSKGQPCFRSSPLPKRYGWGVHSNTEGKVALYAIESEEYKKLSKDKTLEHLKAMRSKRV